MRTNPHRAILAGASGLALAGAALALTPGTAAAQSAAEQLLRQVIPGAGGDAQQVAADAERACERYAEDQRLDVRDILGSRSGGQDEFEVTLRVEDGDEEYDARCFYDAREREVTELEALESTQARGGRDDEETRSTSAWPGRRATPARTPPSGGISTTSRWARRASATATRSRLRSRRATGASGSTSPASTTGRTSKRS
jgi:hypothetical protein